MTEKRNFFRFVVPSIGALLVSGLYMVIDGIFVGRGVGDLGLAAVNLAAPYVTILLATSIMLTMGGAILTSISMSRGDKKEANDYFHNSFIAVVIFAVVMTLISVLFSKQIAGILGASEILIKEVSNYIKYYAAFSIFFSLSLTFSTFIKNDNNPKLALIGMVVGAVANVFLDWLFIFPLKMGVTGAALASGLGQVSSFAILSTHFLFKKGELRLGKGKLSLSYIKEIIVRGTPEFIAQINQPVSMLCFNLIIMRILGEVGVSAYSIIGYTTIVLFAILNGVSQGIQPLISQSYGSGNSKSQKRYLKYGIVTNVVIGIVTVFLVVLFGDFICKLFTDSADVIEIATQGMIYYYIALGIGSFNIIMTTYLYSIKKTKESLVIAISRSVVLNVLFIVVTPLILGSQFIWVGIVIAEIIVAFAALYYYRKHAKNL